MSASLLVRGGTLIDGTGAPCTPGDVRIRGGMIVETGPRLRPDGEPQLDAGGAVVAPGFIDGHTHFDPSVYWDPTCDPMPQHGVTTVLMGNCSLSLAPVREAHRATVSETFGVIEEFPKVAFEQYVPWAWERYGEYVGAMAGWRGGVNIAGLVGWSMLRLFVLGDEAWERPSTFDERAAIAALADEALEAGAAGVSTSYSDVGADGRLVPSAHADPEELAAVLAVVGRHRGHFEFLPGGTTTDRPRAVAMLELAAKLSAASGVTMSWNGFFDLTREPDLCVELLDLAHRFQEGGASVFPTISPRPVDFVVNWHGGLGFRFLPAWHRFAHAESDEKRRLLSDETWRAEARSDWDATTSSIFPHTNPTSVRISETSDPACSAFVGCTLAEWNRDHGGHPSDALADLVARNEFTPGLTYTIGNDDPERLGPLLADSATIVSASDAGAHVQGHCTSGDTTLLLTRYVRERADFTLEAAIAELTGRQADVFGFRDRGRLQVGLAGDLVVFEPDRLTWGEPEALHDFPGGTLRYRRPPGGYRATVLGGVPTQVEGYLTDERPGEWLRGKNPA